MANPAMWDGSRLSKAYVAKQPRAERAQPKARTQLPRGAGPQNPRPIDLDHIFPTGRGGKDEPGNYQLLCRPCHDSKHRNLPEWSGSKS